MQYTHEDPRTKLTYNDTTKKLTVNAKMARCFSENYYGPISLSDVKQLVDMLNSEPDAPLTDVLAKWENI